MFSTAETELKRPADTVGSYGHRLRDFEGPIRARPRPLPVRAWMLTLPIDLLALSFPAWLASDHIWAITAAAVITVALLHGGGRYRARLHVSVLDELPSLVGRAFVAVAIVASVTALRHPSASVSTYLRWGALSIGMLVVGRMITNLIILLARKKRYVRHPTIIVGHGVIALEIDRLLSIYPQYGLQVVGFVDDRPLVRDQSSRIDVARLGSPKDLESLVDDYDADVILIADPIRPDVALLDIVRTPLASSCDLLVVPRLHEYRSQAGLVDHIGAIPIMRIGTPSLKGPSRTAKRAFDLFISGTALFVLSPLMLLVALAVRFEGGRGVFFRQPRMTRDGRIFDVIKFRSMRPINDTESATQWSIAHDSRIGRVGRLIRKTSIDELPQLWNILRGDMTLVGPRPERPYFVEQFSAENPHYAKRHRVVSGLTGLAQVSGLRGDTPIADRARYDNFYIENWSLWLDAKVLMRTIGEVIGARGK